MAEKTIDSNLEEFKKLVRKAIFLTHDEEKYFKAIPNERWNAIFAKNFNSNFNYAQRVMLNQFKKIEEIDGLRVEAQQKKIHNLENATNLVMEAISEKHPVLFITDFDNDGSLAQAIINEYLKVDLEASETMHVEYAQTVNGNSNRGFTVDLVEKIIQHKKIDPQSDFLIITADNGINSREEQMKIHAKFPHATILVTDHHNPDPEMVIEENGHAMIFNPHYKPTEFYQKVNISGATTVGVLLKNVLQERFTPIELSTYKKNIDNINKLSKVSNLLDYVETDPADKPEKDYVITKFLQLQPLLNINNSISKIITGEISTQAVQAIQQKIPQLDASLLYDEAKNIHIQNQVAKILLYIYAQHKNNDKLTAENFNDFFINELNNAYHYENFDNINPNYIEQLRPLIFGLSADDEKNEFLDALNEKMIDVFEHIKVSEKNMAVALRDGEVITKSKLENSVIAYTDPHILSIFNRKFLNKVYNDENPGFTLTLDSIGKGKVSGSFRSLYNISDILKDKASLEAKLNVKIETPGHEKAAGFILKSLDPNNQPITEQTIEAVNQHINASIAQIKANEVSSNATHLLTDLGAIHLIDRINIAVRGNISNFERVNPIIKLTPDTIWTDSYTTKQYSMQDIVNDRKYGYITINTNFHGDTVIIPVELIRRIVQNNYEDYLSLGYMDGGVFMAEKVINKKHVNADKLIDLTDKNEKIAEIERVFSTDFKDKNYVNLTREQIKDNPFFKYHDYGNLNFDLFERMVIGIIDTNQVDLLSVFDVEANGFGNSKLMNFGSMNYSINPKSGQSLTAEEFDKRFYQTQRGEEYLLTAEQVNQLLEITSEQKEELSLEERKNLLIKPTDEVNEDGSLTYYLFDAKEKATSKKKKGLPFVHVTNFIRNSDDTVTYNREIEATMLAYLVKDKDFKVPQEMTNLTGITQSLLNKYGKDTHEVDNDLIEFYRGKEVLFGAHNTPYDARVLRANTPNFYEKLKSSGIYDSALFSRELKLAYDDISVSSFEDVKGLPKNIYFYNNTNSEFNLNTFLDKNKTGYYADRTGQYLLEIENTQDGDSYYLVDKEKHEKIKIQTNQEELIEKMISGPIPNTSVKYSVEKLSEQWMIHALLLSDEKFDIKHVDLNAKPEYAFLKNHAEALKFFQDNYHFDAAKSSNIMKFMRYYETNIVGGEEERAIFNKFVDEFLENNKTIQQKFSDAWMYKKVLSIKEPTSMEITNDLVDLVNYQTNIPKSKIRTIYETAIKFKQKYGIDHIIHHEGHINGPWETDAKGDVAFEDKLTLSLLAQRMYNSYEHSVADAVKTFNEYSLRARLAFDLADQLSDELANDSYSFRQALLYNRDTTTELVNNVQQKETNLANNQGVEIIKFKLANDVLPQDSAVYAVTHKNIQINRDQIEKDNDMLSFILVNEQLKGSIDNVKSGIVKNNLLTILNDNNKIALEYKEELAKRYAYVEFNKKDYQLKEVIELSIEALRGKELKRSRGSKILNSIDSEGFAKISAIMNNYLNGLTKLNPHLEDEYEERVQEIDNHLNTLKESNNFGMTRLEEAFVNSQKPEVEGFATFTEIKDKHFIQNVNIARRDPLKIFMNKHRGLRLINQFVENAQNNALDAKFEDVPDEVLTSKPKMRM
jgi:hypothetical protein